MLRVLWRVVAFVVGAVLFFGFEVLVFGGLETLFGHQLRPVGIGWAIGPFAAGASWSAWSLDWYEALERRWAYYHWRRKRERERLAEATARSEKTRGGKNG